MSDTLDTTRSDRLQAATRDGTASSAAHETRQRIVETASKLFHVYGYQKTTVADIARELGMSPANVYRFFASKAELTKAVTGLVTADLRSVMVTDPGQKAQTCCERLREMVRRHFHHMRERYADNRKIHDLLEAAMEEAWDEIETHKAQMRSAFAEVIRDGISKGEFAEQDVETSAMLFQHSLIMFFHPALVAQTCRCFAEGQQDHLFEPMVDFALAALRDGRFRALPAELKQTV
ncbi:TetR/AcrR family transcriptional regulator [Stappia stellulata]|uniref:TetR/AcrR family transcriptional regulator n=1 Tax=Stappia stellulata TaxID=71235 RepID=UPI0003FEBA9F|nr:TetR family transcriptional regulator [Stappia stellulata]